RPRVGLGGGGGLRRRICGSPGAERAGGTRVFAPLPPLMPIRASDGGSTDWFRAMFEYASSELAVGQPGSDTVLAKLSEVLFVEAVRRHPQNRPAGGTGGLSGLGGAAARRAARACPGNNSPK